MKTSRKQPTATALESTLLDTLAGYLQQKAADIEALLTNNGVDSDLAAIVASAVSAASGNPVTLADFTLDQLLTPFLPTGFTTPASWSSVKFSDLSFTANAKDASLAFAGAITVPVSIAGAGCSFAAELSLASSTSGGTTRQTSGGLTGDLAFASAAFTASYVFDPDGQILTAAWNPTDSSTLDLNALCDATKLSVPGAADTDIISKLAFTTASFELDLGGTTRILIDAQCSLGSAFAIIDCPDSAWVLAIGCQFGSPSITQFSKFGITLPSNLSLSLGAAVMVASTGAIANFQVPNPDTQSAWPFDPFPLDLQQGVTIGALLDLTSGPTASHLQAISAQQGSTSSTAYLLLEAQLPQLNLTVHLGERQLLKSPFVFDLTLTLQSVPSFSITLTGGCEVASTSTSSTTLSGLTFNASLTVTDDSVMGDLDLDYESGFNPPLPFLKGLWIYELAGMMGLDFTSQEVTAGIMGKFSIGDQPQPSSATDPNFANLKTLLPNASGAVQSSNAPTLGDDEFVLILGVNDDAAVAPIPDVNLLILQLSSISLPDFLTAALGKDAPSVSSQVLSGLTAQGIQIYWCDDAPGTICLPDGTSPTPGFRFQGLFDFWNKFKLWSDIEIALSAGASNGFTGQFYMSPINIQNILEVKSDGNQTPPAAMETAMAAAGIAADGPYLYLDTNGSTFLAANWRITVLGWTGTVDVTVASDQFTFSFDAWDSAFNGNFVCRLDTGWEHFETDFSGVLKCTITLEPIAGVDLGTINIDSTFQATLVADISFGYLAIAATFDFEGDTITVPKFDVRPEDLSKLSDLPACIASQIASNATNIFQGEIGEATGWWTKYAAEALKYLAKEESDFKKGVYSLLGLLGIRQKEKTPSWLRNGALLKADGDAIYEVSSNKLRWVPDVTTYDAICAQSNPELTWVSGLMLAALATDSVMVPSRVDGTIFGKQGTQNLYLSVSDGISNAEGTAKYSIQNSQAFLAGCNSLVENPINQVNQDGQVTPSADDDIKTIPNNKLLSSTICTISGAVRDSAGNLELSVFMDGIRWILPDNATYRTLTTKLQSCTAVPPSAYAKMPTSAAKFPAIAPGTLIKSAANAKVYYVAGGNGVDQTLQYVDSKQFQEGFSGFPITTIPDAFFQLLTLKGNYKIPG